MMDSKEIIKSKLKTMEKYPKFDCKLKDCKICVLDSYISPEWKDHIKDELFAEYFNNIRNALHTKKEKKEVYYPPLDLVFKALDFCTLESIKVVIIGQDPYHSDDLAMGLSFSVPKGMGIPPSLQNVYKELERDENIEDFIIPDHGDLTGWAKQGVLLLNNVLTVAKKEANSHADIGWECFTDKIVAIISEKTENVVFMLWGEKAREKSSLINGKKHLILEATHPSPLSCDCTASVEKFRGCEHFSRANRYLAENRIKEENPEINWREL